MGDSMKHRLWLRQLSISAPRMTVRRELPWALRAGFWILPALLVALLISGAYDLGHRTARQGANAEATQDDGTLETRLNLAHATQSQLSTQIRQLTGENARLKEELAYFNQLLPSTAAGGTGVSIKGLAVAPVAPNQVRFRTMVVQAGNGKQRFSGHLQLLVTGKRGGETLQLVYPNDNAQDRDRYKIGFRHFQQLEGDLLLPDGITVTQVQARILENGQVRAQKALAADRSG